MQYFDRFISGGSVDGTRERSAGPSHPTFRGKRLFESGIEKLDIYEFVRSEHTDDGIERIYEFRRTLKHGPGCDFLKDNSRTIKD
jgi:hypothetical protein